MINHKPVIGLEVHVELNTKTKMFCACSAEYFGKEPNTHTCPVCLGLPGALPYTNEEAIKKCMKIGLALNCKVADQSLFERKNYFYPDLPKGYQISQLRWPLNVNGWIEVSGKGGKKTKIGINRAHQEEDTGKLTHLGAETLIDFNRCGVPLVEIVTEPDFTDTEQISDYAKQLREIFRNLGVSAADMEKGDMRLEANVSVRPAGQKELPNYRVELKNINSFKFMVLAVEYEIERQKKALVAGETLLQETRGWNENKRETYLQRSKEEANDYRYFPEPDLPLLEYSKEFIEGIASSLPELRSQKIERFTRDYKLPPEEIEILTRDSKTSEYFEAAVRSGKAINVTPRQISIIMINKKPDIDSPKALVEEIAGRSTRTKIDNPEELLEIIESLLQENEKSVTDYKSGKENAIQSLIGQAMKKTQGRTDAKLLKSLLEERLK